MAEGNLKIYVLQLESGKYYVGSTQNFVARLTQHMEGGGSTFTQAYPVVDVVEVRTNARPEDENMVVRQYMARYGINNVRGGSFSTLTLSAADFAVLEREILHNAGLCIRCGDAGHMVRDCSFRPRGGTAAITPSTSPQAAPRAYPAPPRQAFVPPVFPRPIAAQPAPPKVRSRREYEEENYCSRCGRDNHSASTCYAKTTVDGDWPVNYGPGLFCSRCGRDGHSSWECYARYTEDGDRL